jgi:hypothetical protein
MVPLIVTDHFQKNKHAANPAAAAGQSAVILPL